MAHFESRTKGIGLRICSVKNLGFRGSGPGILCDAQ